VLYLFPAGGQLVFGAAVNYGNIGAEALCGARRVHSNVAAAYYNRLFCVHNGGCAAVFIGFHKVIAG